MNISWFNHLKKKKIQYHLHALTYLVIFITTNFSAISIHIYTYFQGTYLEIKPIGRMLIQREHILKNYMITCNDSVYSLQIKDTYMFQMPYYRDKEQLKYYRSR